MILVDKDSRLLEGLSSNFFVYQHPYIYTANEGILPGTIRNIVLKVCEELNIDVIYEPPNLKNLEKWDEAFITSTNFYKKLLIPFVKVRVDW